jgi:uncharacterized protein (DUF885 family)
MRAVVIIALLLAGGAAADAPSPEARFHALAEREWAWRLEQYPELATSVGVHDHDARLTDVGEAAQQARRRHEEAALVELDAIDAAALPRAERVNYRILRGQIRDAIGDVALGAYLMPVNSDSSFHAEIAQLPRQMRFETELDVENYLARLAAVPAYFDQNIALLRAGVKRGFTVPRVVLEGHDGGLAASAAVADPTQSALYAPLKSLPPAIPRERADALRARARRTIADDVTPAYARVAAFMAKEYVPHARRTIAAEALPGGKAFYREQIRRYTTLELAPDAIHRIGLDEVARIRAGMQKIIAEVKFDGDFGAFLAFLRTDPQFYAKTPEELLMRAAWVAKRVDAQLPKLFGTLPRRPFGIEPVPEAIAPYYTGGRYVGAPEGGTEPGFYWVNTYALESRPLYTQPALTLHESVPGHHLQIALAAEQAGQPPYRRYSYISAFGEGWGLYAEKLGEEMGIYRTPYERFGRLTYEMWRACRLVVDTGMHAKGWTRAQAIAYLTANTALSAHEIETETDRYISWPGQALSYKLGELKIRELRARAEDRLGAKFDLRAFHDAVLALGSVPLPVLEEEIDAFIAERAR